ncbi:hypothetical protein P8452_58203 [Trifolium repens]|nr:hypothetical protein P8452_58203 [Trifolium repens]
MSSRCTEKFRLRKIKNDQLKVEAKAKGEVISTQRKPEGPKPGFMVEGAIHWKQYSNHTITQHELNLLSSARNQRNTKNSNKFKLNLFIFKITKSSNLRHSHFSWSLRLMITAMASQ